jgi:hypothetical protein
MKEDFVNRRFILKIVPYIERRDKDKPSEGSKYYIKF